MSGQGTFPTSRRTKEIVHVGEFGGVIALFEKAKEYLKYPKITLALSDGSPLQLNLAGKGSKFPGTVGLTDGGSYGDNKWYGRVTKEGAWEPAKLSDQLKTDLSSILAQLATQPAQLAAKYGKLTGHCCFCNSELSTRSRRMSATARSAPSAGACHTARRTDLLQSTAKDLTPGAPERD